MVNIEFWNVRTVFQSSKAAKGAKEFINYKLDIFGINECSCTGSGKMKLISEETVLCSGRETEHVSGPALQIGRLAESSLKERCTVSDRIYTARFNSKLIKMTVVVCYAPTNTADNDDGKARFNEKLDAIKGVNRHDVLIVGGNFNAKVGCDNSGRNRCFGCDNSRRNRCIGKFGLLFSDFCQENGFVIGDTLFQYKPVHRYKWQFPDGLIHNQIKDMAINRKLVASLRDVRSKRGADVGSDHVMVVTKLQLSLRRQAKTIETKKYDMRKLKSAQGNQKFILKVANRFEE